MAWKLHTEVVPISEVNGVSGLDSGLPVVLVVDDEEIVADTLALIIGKAGFCALKAYRADEALAMARLMPPALLLTDVQMPGMNGVELALQLTSEQPDCRVLLFSGHAVPVDLSAARAAGYDFPLLGKPLHPVELLEHISTSLGVIQGNAARSPQRVGDFIGR